MEQGTIDIRHDDAGHRFVTTVDGVDGYLEYAPSDGAITITHTVVPDAIGGRGIGGQLVKAALDHARTAGLKVVPRCSYALAYMDKHPEYGDLRR